MKTGDIRFFLFQEFIVIFIPQEINYSTVWFLFSILVQPLSFTGNKAG